MPGSSNTKAGTAAPPASDQPTQNKRRIDVVIVGAGDETLIEVGPVLGDQFRTYSVDQASDIASLAATSWIGLYDATGPAASRAAFAQLESQYGKQPWIILCADEQDSQWQNALARGSACAVVPQSQIGAAGMAAALARAAQRTVLAAPNTHAVPPGKAAIPMPWVVGAAAIAAAAAAGWWLNHSRHGGAPLPGPATVGAIGPRLPRAGATAGSSASASVEDLLSQARVAFADPATQLPRADAPLQGTSALELYGAVLAQQPRNDEALDGVRRLQSVARLRIQNDLASGDVETAARLLSILEHSDVLPGELRTLESAVAAARPKQLAAQARTAIAAGNLTAAQQYIDQLVALTGQRSPVPELKRELDGHRLDMQLTTDAEQVRAAITAGALLEPEADNARTRLLAMRDLSRTSPQTLATQHELLLALLHRVQTSIGRQDLDGAQQILTAAQEFGTRSELADARTALDTAISARRAAEAASAAAEAAQNSAQSGSAPHAIAQTVISPKPTRPLQIDFPRTALEHDTQGYVVVEFMLNPNGSAAAATVVESSPAGTFDRAAMDAVKRATFATRDLTDPKTAQRARIKINFDLAQNTQPGQAVAKAPAATNGGSTAILTQAILSPKPTRPMQVDYPPAALASHTRGYAIVEFVLNPNGSAGSPTVVESSPAGIFDRAALSAVKGVTFVTKDLADPHQPQRARVKINFSAE